MEQVAHSCRKKLGISTLTSPKLPFFFGWCRHVLISHEQLSAAPESLIPSIGPRGGNLVSRRDGLTRGEVTDFSELRQF